MTKEIKRHLPTLPKIVFWLTPLLISLEAGMSMFLGYLVADFIAGKKSNQQGRVRSLVFNIRSYRVHLHHWVVFLGCLGLAFFLRSVVGGVPSVVYGFLGGVVAQGIMDYDDWKSVVKKRLL